MGGSIPRRRSKAEAFYHHVQEVLKHHHGVIFFSPTKGYHCDLLCKDKKQSWVHATSDTSLMDAVEDALTQQRAIEDSDG